MELTATATASTGLVRLSGGTNKASSDEESRRSVSDRAEKEPLDDPQSSESKSVAELKKTDRTVRAHEQAHVAASGQFVRGGAQLQFVRGPDGQNYAVGGEVRIDTSAIPDDPEATIRKMETVRRAALAPLRPSSQDQAVAASAGQAISQARAEVLRNRLSGEEEAINRYQDTADADSDSDSGNALDLLA